MHAANFQVRPFVLQLGATVAASASLTAVAGARTAPHGSPRLSGCAAFERPRAKLASATGAALPLNMQASQSSVWRTTKKSNPAIPGFVVSDRTERIPAKLAPPPERVTEHKLVHDHEHDLLINMTTRSPFKFHPNAPLFRPLGSVQPATHVRRRSRASGSTLPVQSYS